MPLLFSRLMAAFASPLRVALTVAAAFSVGLAAPAQSTVLPAFGGAISYNTGVLGLAQLVGKGALQAAAADFNGDGIKDLVVANLGDGTISVLIGKGDGSFLPPARYTVGQGPYGIAAGDFNGDGKPDIAVVDQGDATVSILLNTGGGFFAAAPTHTYPVGTSPYGISIADFNKDGRLDLAVTNNGSQTVSVLFGGGDGTFLPAAAYPVGNYPYGTVAGDLNGDGYPDLVVWNIADSTVGVLMNDTTGKFLPQVTYPTGLDPYSVAVADFTGDGSADLVVANIGSNTVSVLLNDKTGKFLPQVTYATGVQPSGVIAVDLNADGIVDLAVTNLDDGTVGILLGKGDGTFLAQSTIPVIAQPYALLSADFDGDGNPDLAVTNFLANDITILLQNASTGPPIGVSSQVIGNNLIEPIAISLNVAPLASGTLTVSSSDPTHFLLSTSQTAIGSASVTINLTKGSVAIAPIYLQGLNYAGNTAITANITASAAGYSNGTGVASLYPTGFGIGSYSALGTTTTLSPPTSFYVTINTESPGTLLPFYSGASAGAGLGPQAPTVQVAVTSSNTSVATISGGPITIGPGLSGGSGFSLNPVGAGTTTVSVVEPAGYFGSSSFLETVTAPQIYINDTTVANNGILNLPVVLGNAAPAAGTLTLTSSDPGHFLLSTDTQTPGVASLSFNVPAGGSYFPSIYLQGQNYGGTTAIMGSVTATLAGYQTRVAGVTLYPSGFGFVQNVLSVPNSGPHLTGISFLTLNPGTLTWYSPGGQVSTFSPAAGPTLVTVTNSDPTVGTLTGVPVAIVPNADYTTFLFHPLAEGTTTLTVTEPGGYATPMGVSRFVSQAITVTAGTASSVISTPNPTATVKAGDAAHFNLLVTSPVGNAEPVNLSCGSLPSGMSCAFSPSALTPSPAGTAVSLIVSTTAAQTSLLRGIGSRSTGGSVLACLLLVSLRRRRLALSLFALLVLVSGTGLSGCGTKTSTLTFGPGTPLGYNAVTVIATPAAGGTSHSVQIMIVVTP